MTSSIAAPENKAGYETISGAFDDLARTLAAFREANDQRLLEIETRLSADVVTEEKLARIDRAVEAAQSRLDALALKARRPALGCETGEADAARDRHGFARYLRSGATDGLRAYEEKAWSVGSGPDGGYIVPPSTEREILTRMAVISPIRALAEVREVSSASFKKAIPTTAFAAGWVGETANRTETNTETLADLTFPTAELYAMPAATQTILDDAAVDVEALIAGEIENVFAEAEGAAFVAGDGTNKPKGFLAYAKVAQSAWTPDKTGYLVTGAAGAFAATNPSDVLIDLIYALKSGYRQNASFVMNRRVQSVIRRFRDSTGNYLWQPPAGAGQRPTLMNFPVVDAEDMPDIGADAYAIAFGDFRRGYLVVDRTGIRVLRDPYTAKPFVRFYTTKRVGGGVQDFDAIKLLKFGAT